MQSNDEIRRKIIEVVCPLPTNFRMIIAERMEDAGDDEFALSLLGLYDQEIDEEVKTQASIAYHKRLKLAGSDITNALDLLSKNIVFNGPGLESHRAAAFCGLVFLNRLDVVAKCKEIKSENPCSVPLRDFLPNIPLIRTILQEWNDIKEAFGLDMLRRFAHWNNEDTIEVWNTLCILADEYPRPREEAVEFLEMRTEKIVEANILKFLSKTRPGSKLLRNYCLNSFYANQNGIKLAQNDVFTAAKLLGTHFRDNEETLFAIALKYKEVSFDSKLIIALCEGWPTCKKLDDMYNYYLKNKPKIDYETYFYLISIKGSSEFVYDAILRAIHHVDSEHIGPLYSIIPPVLHRLRSDETLVKKLIGHLIKNNPTSSEKVIIPRMIIDAVGISQEFRAWCQDELQRQFNMADAFEIGIDLGSGKPKAVIHALLEVLSQSDRSNL